MSGVLSLKPTYYEALKRLTLELAGVKLGADHAFLVETRLSNLVRHEGYESLNAMVEDLFKTGQTRLAVQVVSALLERDTHFYKDRASFQNFEAEILPKLYAARKGGKVKILSFGCATGQDAYSIAMTHDRLKSDYPDMELEVVGADYPSDSLDRARSGRYSHFDIQRGLPVRELLEYFYHAPEPDSTDWIIKDSIKQKVSFQDVHLLSNLSTLSQFHAVLFRGALPHYSSTAKVRVLRGLASLVLPYGYLLLGSDEALNQINFGFDKVEGSQGLYLRHDDTVDGTDTNAGPAHKTPNGRTHFNNKSPRKSA